MSELEQLIKERDETFEDSERMADMLHELQPIYNKLNELDAKIQEMRGTNLTVSD